MSKQHVPLAPDNQYCKHCGEAMFVKEAMARPCTGHKVLATPYSEQCTGCEDMAECIEAVAFLGSNAVCVKTNSILDAKDISYNSASLIDKWIWQIVIIGCIIIIPWIIYVIA